MLVESCSDAVFVIDLETEESVYVSPAVHIVLGRSPEELIGRPLTDFVHPNDAAEVLARSSRRRDGRGPHTTVTRMSHADGGWVWVQAAASPVIRYEDRPVTVFTVTAAAERVRAEVGLSKARSQLRHLLAEVSGGDGRLLAWDGSHDLAVEALAAALELRDDETGQHARRVTDLALELTCMVDSELARDRSFATATSCMTSGRSVFRTRSSSTRIASLRTRSARFRCTPRLAST
jgi:PAS domain S-box-containing protein